MLSQSQRLRDIQLKQPRRQCDYTASPAMAELLPMRDVSSMPSTHHHELSLFDDVKRVTCGRRLSLSFRCSEHHTEQLVRRRRL